VARPEVTRAAQARPRPARQSGPILRVSAARATAKAIDGARLVVLQGVGHDLPAPLWPAIAKEVRQLADPGVYLVPLNALLLSLFFNLPVRIRRRGWSRV
jgi:hypothetical protein